MPKLVLLSEGLTGRTHELKVEKTTVGRLDDNTFCIPEASVSSHHCELYIRGKDLVIKDLGSTNGTFIAGQQVTEGTLKAGQILRLGNVQMRFEGDVPTAQKQKMPDHTMVIPQGVQLNELESQKNPVSFETDSPFAKKSNRVNRIFIVVGVILGLVIIALLVYIFKKQEQMNTPGGQPTEQKPQGKVTVPPGVYGLSC